MNHSHQPATAIRHVCVYCGSGSGSNPLFAAAARELGSALAAAKIGLVYGGGGYGLMGEVARACKAAGGHVTGIIPDFLVAKERALDGLDEMIVTADMHQRKRLMFERSDAFVALPGGIGTLEELIEQMTWAQLGQHNRPIVIANIAGFWQPLLNLLDHMRKEAYIRDGLVERFGVVGTAAEIVPALQAMAATQATRDTDATILTKF